MRLKKPNFETFYCFLRQLVPDVPHDTIVTLKNEAHREESGCEAPHKYEWFCMILWGASYCAFLYKNQTRPKMSCLKDLKTCGITVMPCLGITSLWDNFGPNCLGIIFGKRGAPFLSLGTARIVRAARQVICICIILMHPMRDRTILHGPILFHYSKYYVTINNYANYRPSTCV